MEDDVRSVYTRRYETLLRFLVSARNDAGLTQVELGDRLGKPQSFVSKFERGERRLDVVELVEIAEVLEFDVCKLVETIQSHKSGRRG